jgi:hypothetical protein
MRYTKPIILATNRAASAIRGQGKVDTTKIDGSDLPTMVAAYEADE